MRLLPVAALCIAGATLPSAAREPPRVTKHDRWIAAVNAAWSDLEACKQVGVAAKVYGDVQVTIDPKSGAWTKSSSRSLGKLRGRLEACVYDAIASRLKLTGESDWDDRHAFEHTHTIGTPVMVLPPASTLMPVWWRVVAHGSDAAKARSQLAKLLPPDYTLKGDCVATDRQSIERAEYLWLPTAGSWVPRMWDKLMTQAIGSSVHVAMWDRAGAFVTKSTRGLCLEPFDAKRQAALRTQFDSQGSGWVGGFEDILLHPRTELPRDKRYVSVSTQSGRVCAVTTAGDVACAGPNEPPLPPAPAAIASIALGYGFACGLDKRGTASCWGDIVAPPTGTFTKLSASYKHACGVKSNGSVACWGTGNYDVAKPPSGTFVDVSASQFSTCGIHKDGTAECWGEPRRELHPPGAFTHVAATWTHACGVRRDKTVGCWTSKGYPVETYLPDKLKDVVVADQYQLCGRRDDDTVACFGYPPVNPSATLRPPPATKFTQLAADHATACGLRGDGGVECWGEVWPGTLGDNTWVYSKVMGVSGAAAPASRLTITGRVVDESAKPLAGADVAVCTEYGPCTTLLHEAKRSPGTLAALNAAIKQPTWAADSFAIATTGADGRWTATVTQHPPTNNASTELRAVVTAVGREIVEKTASPSEAAKLGADIRLRPASSLDVDVKCGATPCAGKLVLDTGHDRFEGTHLERLSPATYKIELSENPTQVGERHGSASVEVTFAPKPLRVQMAMKPIGTGKSIRGTIELSNSKRSLDKVKVNARCEGGGKRVYRSAQADAKGAFEILDVGEPPCKVDLGPDSDPVDVDKVPATGIHVKGHERWDRP